MKCYPPLSILLATIILLPNVFSESFRSKFITNEPNQIGFTFDSNDVAYMDFLLSVQYVLGSNDSNMDQHGAPKGFNRARLFGGFNGRFAQYIGTRKSAPVLGKRFNPFLSVRWWPQTGINNHKNSSYFFLDFGFGHESNGQSISTNESYQARRNALRIEGQNPDFAIDEISRGWDYMNTSVVFVHKPDQTNNLHARLDIHHWLDDGILQNKPEEYNDWEGPRKIKERKTVDGLKLTLSHHFSGKLKKHLGRYITLKYTTGYKNIFKHQSIQADLGISINSLPVTIWAASGYNSDLTDYHKYVNSVGFAFKFSSFKIESETK